MFVCLLYVHKLGLHRRHLLKLVRRGVEFLEVLDGSKVLRCNELQSVVGVLGVGSAGLGRDRLGPIAGGGSIGLEVTRELDDGVTVGEDAFVVGDGLEQVTLSSRDFLLLAVAVADLCLGEGVARIGTGGERSVQDAPTSIDSESLVGWLVSE